jgi:hypothetical protein
MKMKIKYAHRSLLEVLNSWSLQHHNHGYDKSCFKSLDSDMFLLDDEGTHAELYMRNVDLNALPIFDTGDSITLH